MYEVWLCDVSDGKLMVAAQDRTHVSHAACWRPNLASGTGNSDNAYTYFLTYAYTSRTLTHLRTLTLVLHAVRDHATGPRDRTHSIETSDSGRPFESIASCVAASLTTSETVPLRPSSRLRMVAAQDRAHVSSRTRLVGPVSGPRCMITHRVYATRGLEQRRDVDTTDDRKPT